MSNKNRKIEEIKLFSTDYNGTLDPSYLEIGLGYLALQNNITEKHFKRSFELFFKEQPKLWKWLREGGFTNLLHHFGEETLKGEDPEILDNYGEKISDGNFDKNLGGSLRLFYKIIPSKLKRKIEADYYPGSMETFEKVSKKTKTMIYTHAIKELVESKLEYKGFKDFFTEGIIGNHFKIDENGKLDGIQWEVDGPNTPKENQKKGLLEFTRKLEINPHEISYIDDNDVGILKELRDKGGTSIIAPSADDGIKENGVKNKFFVPEYNGEEGWHEIMCWLGIENNKYYFGKKFNH